MEKKDNDTEGKGNLPKDEDKTPLNGEGVASTELHSKEDKPEGNVSGEETNNNPEKGTVTQGIPNPKKGASEGEAASKKEETAPSKNTGKDNANAPKPKPSPQQKKAADAAKATVEMMDGNKTDILFENSKGEFFTNENLALLSEKGVKDKVKTIRRENLELLIKSVE